MARKTLLILNLLACSSAACTEGEENCLANHDGEKEATALAKEMPDSDANVAALGKAIAALEAGMGASF